MKTSDFLLKKAKADYDNNMPDPDGNNMMFGKRQECLNPTLLNAARERLGFRPELQSPFVQCQTKKPRW